MCKIDALRTELLQVISDESDRFDEGMKQLGDRMDYHAKQIGLMSSSAFNADVSSAAALKATEEIKDMLKNAHVADAAKVFSGGEVLAKGIIALSKLLVAAGIIYASWVNIPWQSLVFWRPH